MIYAPPSRLIWTVATALTLTGVGDHIGCEERASFVDQLAGGLGISTKSSMAHTIWGPRLVNIVGQSNSITSNAWRIINEKAIILIAVRLDISRWMWYVAK